MNDLVITKVVENLDDVNRKNVLDTFTPIIIELNKMGKSFKPIQELETSPEKSVLAKRFRIDFGRVLTSADNARKGLKEESLKTGKSIQAVYNYIKEATSDIKNEAKDIELHYERIEEEKKKQLQVNREIELQKYDSDGEFVDLGNMPDPVWNNYLAGVKNNFEAIKEAERKAEADRIEQENIDNLNEERRVSILNLWQFLPEENKNENFGAWADDMWDELVNYLNLTKSDYDKEQEEIKAENERLKIEADKAEKKRIAEQKKLAKEKAKQEAIRIEEQKKIDAERIEQENIIRKEREVREKLERDIVEKEAERLRLEKEESDRLKAEQKKANNAPDKQKLEKLVFYMEEIGRGLKGPEAKEIVREAYRLIKGYSKSL